MAELTNPRKMSFSVYCRSQNATHAATTRDARRLLPGRRSPSPTGALSQRADRWRNALRKLRMRTRRWLRARAKLLIRITGEFWPRPCGAERDDITKGH